MSCFLNDEWGTSDSKGWVSGSELLPLPLLMTDTDNNRMVKKKQTNKQKTLNIKDLRSACLEIFFSLFRPWCEVEIYVSSEFGTPHPSFSAPFLPKIPGSFPWDSPTISAPDAESIDLSSIFGQCIIICHVDTTPFPLSPDWCSKLVTRLSRTNNSILAYWSFNHLVINLYILSYWSFIIHSPTHSCVHLFFY